MASSGKGQTPRISFLPGEKLKRGQKLQLFRG